MVANQQLSALYHWGAKVPQSVLHQQGLTMNVVWVLVQTDSAFVSWEWLFQTFSEVTRNIRRKLLRCWTIFGDTSLDSRVKLFADIDTKFQVYYYVL